MAPAARGRPAAAHEETYGTHGQGRNLPSAVRFSGQAADAYRAAFDWVYGELNGGQIPDAGRSAALRAVLRSQGFTDADVDMIVGQHVLAPIQASNYAACEAAPGLRPRAVRSTPPPVA